MKAYFEYDGLQWFWSVGNRQGLAFTKRGAIWAAKRAKNKQRTRQKFELEL